MTIDLSKKMSDMIFKNETDQQEKDEMQERLNISSN